MTWRDLKPEIRQTIDEPKAKKFTRKKAVETSKESR
jgi:hypothetical protein